MIPTGSRGEARVLGHVLVVARALAGSACWSMLAACATGGPEPIIVVQGDQPEAAVDEGGEVGVMDAGVEVPRNTDTTSTGGDDAGPAAHIRQPEMGEILISEIMFRPSGADPEPEWFELHNATGMALRLSGLTLVDGSNRRHKISATPELTIEPGAYMVLARDRAAAQSTGLATAQVAYAYGTGMSGVTFNNADAGSLAIENEQSAVVASCPYVQLGYGSGAVAKGHSLQLRVLNAQAAAERGGYCVSGARWLEPTSDFGTPGLANDCPP